MEMPDVINQSLLEGYYYATCRSASFKGSGPMKINAGVIFDPFKHLKVIMKVQNFIFDPLSIHLFLVQILSKNGSKIHTRTKLNWIKIKIQSRDHHFSIPFIVLCKSHAI